MWIQGNELNIELGGATEVVLTADQTQVLTNKTIIATTNRVDIGVMEAPSEAEGA